MTTWALVTNVDLVGLRVCDTLLGASKYVECIPQLFLCRNHFAGTTWFRRTDGSQDVFANGIVEGRQFLEYRKDFGDVVSNG